MRGATIPADRGCGSHWRLCHPPLRTGYSKKYHYQTAWVMARLVPQALFSVDVLARAFDVIGLTDSLSAGSRGACADCSPYSECAGMVGYSVFKVPQRENISLTLRNALRGFSGLYAIF